MLEVVSFNNKLYRFRKEDEDTMLLYNLLSGEMYFIKGRGKDILLSMDKGKSTELDSEDKIVKFLKCINAISSPK